MAATPEIDTLIAEIRKFRNSDRPAPIMQDIDSTYIPAWESITTGAGAVPGAPDTSVQFNDGGAFGGSAFFTFAKARGEVSIASAQSSGTVSDLASLTISFTQSGTGHITNKAYGLHILSPVYGGTQIDKIYGIYIEQHSRFQVDTEEYNLYSNGDNSQNAFLGYSSFGTKTPAFSSTVTITNGGNFNTFNLRSQGTDTHNLFDGHAEIDQTLRVFGHSGFGSNNSINVLAPVYIEEHFSGTMNLGTYGSIVTGSRYNPSSGNPAIFEAQFFAILDAGTASTISGLSAGSDVFGTCAVLEGAQIFAQVENVGTVTAGIIGLDLQSINSSHAVGTLPSILGLQVLCSSSGAQPTTNMYGIFCRLNLDAGVSVVNNYGIWIETQTAGNTRKYNIWSDWQGNTTNGHNYFGSGIEVGVNPSATNISEVAAGVVGIGTGTAGSIAGTIKAAVAAINGAVTAGKELTVHGDTITDTLCIAGALAGGEVFTATGAGSITGAFIVGSTLNVTSNTTTGGFNDAASYKVGGAAGATGSFTTADAKTVNVTSGIVVSIV